MIQTLERFSSNIQRIGDIYRESPEVQILVANAPAILQHFKEARMLSLQYQQEMNTLMLQQENDLAKFREKAPAMITEIRLISDEIRLLQKIVREQAATIAQNPQAKTIIDYTNNQIAQQISMFNNLTILFMNS